MAQGLEGLGPVYGAALLLSAALAAWGAWLCARGLGALWDARWFARLGAGPRSTRGAMWGAAGGATAIIAGGVIAAVLLHAGLPDGAGTVAQRASMVGSLSLVLAGLVVVLVGLRFDPPGARARCPRCWYDMASLATGSACPECGHTPRDARALRRTRRSGALIALGLVLLAVSYPLWRWPAMRATSWRAMVPSTLLIAGWRWLPETLVLNGTMSDAGSLEDRTFAEGSLGVARWQRGWLARSVERAWADTRSLEVGRRALRLRAVPVDWSALGAGGGNMWTMTPQSKDQLKPTQPAARLFVLAARALGASAQERARGLDVLAALALASRGTDWSEALAQAGPAPLEALRSDAQARAVVLDVLRACSAPGDAYIDAMMTLATDRRLTLDDRDAALVALGAVLLRDRAGLDHRLRTLLDSALVERRLDGLTALRSVTRFRTMDEQMRELFDAMTARALADPDQRVVARALALRVGMADPAQPDRALVDALVAFLRDGQGEARLDVLEALGSAPLMPMLTLPLTAIDLDAQSTGAARALAGACWHAVEADPDQLGSRERAWLEVALADRTLPKQHAMAMRGLLSRPGG